MPIILEVPLPAEPVAAPVLPGAEQTPHPKAELRTKSEVNADAAASSGPEQTPGVRTPDRVKPPIEADPAQSFGAAAPEQTETATLAPVRFKSEPKVKADGWDPARGFGDDLLDAHIRMPYQVPWPDPYVVLQSHTRGARQSQAIPRNTHQIPSIFHNISQLLRYTVNLAVMMVCRPRCQKRASTRCLSGNSGLLSFC